MRRLALLMIVPLAACDQGSTAPPPTPKIVVRSAGQDAMHQLNDLNRAIALKRAIYDSGGVCKLLTASNALGDYKNMAMWRASCADGKSWAVFIAPDGSAQVRPCGDLRELKLPQCDVADSKTAGTRPAVPNAPARSR